MSFQAESATVCEIGKSALKSTVRQQLVTKVLDIQQHSNCAITVQCLPKSKNITDKLCVFPNSRDELVQFAGQPSITD